jgi:putative heme-binding domain-containing protein
MRAQQAIIKVGLPALNEASEMLTDENVDPVARRHLVWVVDGIARNLGEGGALLFALGSKVDDVRAQAIRAIGERRYKEAAGPLMGVLQDDPSPVVKLQAIIALGRLGEPRTVEALVPYLTNPDRYLAFSARQAIRRIGDWPAVARGLLTKDEKLRGALLATLERVYDKGATAILAAYAAGSTVPEAERAKALTELAEVARKAPEWDGKWWGTRPTQGKPPARTISWEATTDVLKAIESHLADPSEPVRLAAVSAVRSTDDRAALPMLRERFGLEKEPKVRQEVALALGSMGDKEALPLLIAALRDLANPEGVRSASLAGLESIGGKPAIAALVEALTNKEENLKDETQARMVAALGRFKAKEAIPAILGRLSHASPAVRVASAEALGKIGDVKAAAPQLRAVLKDPAVEVRKAVAAALARLKDVEAIPGLIELANDEPTRYEGTLALATLPDIRALQVYLRGVADKSPDLRKASSTAIRSIREKAEPVLEQLASRRELAPAALPELRKIYNELQAVDGWHVMGPFPFDDRPPVRTNMAVDLAGTAPGPDGSTLAWKPIAIEGEHGMLDLNKVYSGKGDCSVFGSAVLESPVARPAQMAVGSDDTLTVWLNGKEVYKFAGDRGYDPEASRFDVELKKGKNLLVVKCGNHGGLWQYSVAVTGLADYAFLKGPSTGGFDPDKFKAAALKGNGKADKGKALFADLKGLACVKCHVVGGEGGNIGPDLSGIGARYPREELITSILYPSAKIFSGYETVVVDVADGRVLTGLIKSDNADGLEIQDAEGKRVKIAKADIETRKTSDLSLMPNGIVEGISPQDFADLVAYLEILKDASANQGKPPGE